MAPKPSTSQIDVADMSMEANSFDEQPSKVFIRVPRRRNVPNHHKYKQKFDQLAQLCNDVSEQNHKFRYHIACVRKEISRLMVLKRSLCQRLSEYDDNYMDEAFEIPDTSRRDERLNEVIDNVIANPEIELPIKPVKKQKIEKKRVRQQSEDDQKKDSRETIERILHAASTEIQKREQRERTQQPDL